MRRRLLVIYKDPEFDERDEVILGQCEPFTSGWKLVLIPPAGEREVLQTGTYTDLRKIQESCASLGEAEAVRRRVQEMRALLTSSVTETVAVEFSEEKAHDSTKLLEAVKVPPSAAGNGQDGEQAQAEAPAEAQAAAETASGNPPASSEGPFTVPAQLGEGLLELKQESGAIVALLADPERASDAALLNPQLRRLLEFKPRAIVLDLGRVQHLASRMANELILFRDECQEQRVGFGLCNLRKSVLRLFENLEHKKPPAMYPSPEAAVAEMTSRTSAEAS
jgi:anti-anti-sigma regulatory factor